MRMVLLLLTLACCAGPDAGCRPEKVAELPLILRGSVPVVRAEINGAPVALVIDTGSDVTVLTRSAAARVGLAADAGAANVGGAGGVAQVGRVRLPSLVLGGVETGSRRALLAEAPAPPLDGLLGIDVLVGFELELDAPHRRAALWRVRSCAAAQPAWEEATALAVQQAPRSGHLFVPVLVDGQPMRGMLDSGSSRAALSLQAAGEVGLSGRRLAELPSLRGQALNAGGVLVRTARLRSLQVGRDVLEGPVVSVLDLPAFAGDLLVGADYLSTRRVWVSFRLGRVWVADGSVVAKANREDPS